MNAEKSPNALRTIGEVANDLGVATHVLRFWESKFHQIKPQKRRGRRYYRPQDITTLKQIQALLYTEGYTIKGVQKFLQLQVKQDSKPTTSPLSIVASNPDFEEATPKQTTATMGFTESNTPPANVDHEDLFAIYVGLTNIKEKLQQVG